jgi:hypothetical protein
MTINFLRIINLKTIDMKLKIFFLMFGIFTQLSAFIHPKPVDTCFNPSNFALELKYVQWKAQTSKIGRVLVNDFEVKIADNQELSFQGKNSSKLEFKINAQELMMLISEKSPRRKINRQNKAESAFCELLKRAKIWGWQYLKE